MLQLSELFPIPNEGWGRIQVYPLSWQEGQWVRKWQGRGPSVRRTLGRSATGKWDEGQPKSLVALAGCDLQLLRSPRQRWPAHRDG